MDPTASGGSTRFSNESVWQLELPEIRFGTGAVLDLPMQLGRLGVEEGSQGVVVTDQTIVDLGHANRVVDVLQESFAVDVWSESGREPTVVDVETCVQALSTGFDEVEFVIGLGGGSALDTAKAARAVLASGGSTGQYVDRPFGPGERLSGTPAPLVAVPTTGGSPAQISPVASVKTDDDRKAVISGPQVRPEATIADPEFSVTMGPKLTAATSMDALAPALESYTSIPLQARPRTTDGTARDGPTGRMDLTNTLAERSIELLWKNVKTVVHRGDDLDAREQVMLGTLYASIAGRGAGVNLAHATGYAVQELYHTTHAVSVGVMAPQTIFGYNAATQPEQYRTLATLLGVDTGGTRADVGKRMKRAFIEYQRDLDGFPSGLRSLIGIDGSEAELRALARRTLEQERLLDKNPRPASEEGLLRVFEAALENWEVD